MFRKKDISENGYGLLEEELFWVCGCVCVCLGTELMCSAMQVYL